MSSRATILCLLLSSATALASNSLTKEAALVQTWSSALDEGKGGAQDTPVTRVVKLLQEMHRTLKKEMDEDEALYDKMACWCSNTKWEKKNSIEKYTAKVAELEALIEELTAKKAELQQNLKETEAQVAADKQALAEAQAIRDKQLKEFHGYELDAIQDLENLRAAIQVLQRHFAADGGGMTPDSTVAGGAVFKSEKDSWATFLEKKSVTERINHKKSKSKDPWTDALETSHDASTMDSFMSQNSMFLAPGQVEKPEEKLLQQRASATAALSLEDESVVKTAYSKAAKFLQTHDSAQYYPAYAAQSGQILGILKTMQDEMEAGLAEEQKLEAKRAEDFAALRAAKTEAIEKGEKRAENLEDEHATCDNDLGEAKEDLGVTKEALAADEKYLANAIKMCDEADKNWAERKKARTEEIAAVAETIEILTTDEARDAMSGTYSFLQESSASAHQKKQRKSAADKLRKVALKHHSPMLSALATSVELDAFTKVKKAIDEMIAMLKEQMAVEVKKNDWCKDEIQQNEMSTMKMTTYKEDLEAKIEVLKAKIKKLAEEIKEAKAAIVQLKVDLQAANEARKKENYDFQTTVADQLATIDVLKTALNRLATYFDSEGFLQKQKARAKQTPPVPQMTYEKSKGAGGVMQMIEKLIYEAKALMAESIAAENEAEAAYEQVVVDTNEGVAALEKEIVEKEEAKAQTIKDLELNESDLADAVKELEGLAKYNTELHTECDYLLKNFDLRQKMRGDEIEALQQAKQILSGANLES